MSFTEGKYAAFLAVVFVLFWALRRHRTARHMLLLGASYFFYAQWNVKYLGLLLFATLLNFEMGRRLDQTEDPRHRKLLLACSVVGSLAVLAIFKYFNFFITSVAGAVQYVGLPIELPTLRVLLPIGISFYTFHTLSYTIDIYRGRLKPTQNLIDFGIFVAFFPLLVSGPIIRASHFLPQLEQAPEYSDERTSSGLYMILKGLIKKVIIADMIGRWLVDAIFKDPMAFHSLRVLIGIYGYAFQIYGDFAGYTDVAIGSARLLGLELPINFNRPYVATNLRDFWQRWHISLSTWLRDYLYISLGGSRSSPRRTQLNLFVTMLLGGLWHGANWTFVVWGALHGGALALTRAVQRRGGQGNEEPAGDSRPLRLLKGVLTFHTVCLGWVFFRSPDFRTAASVLRSLGTGGKAGFDHPYSLLALALLVVAFVLHLTPKAWDAAAERLFVHAPAPAQAVALVFAVTAVVLVSGNAAPFIYFQF